MLRWWKFQIKMCHHRSSHPGFLYVFILKKSPTLGHQGQASQRIRRIRCLHLHLHPAVSGMTIPGFSFGTNFRKKNGCFPEYVAGWWWVCLWKWFPLSTWCLAVPDISADVSRWMPSSGRTLTIAEACAAAASGTVGETVQEHGDWCFLVDETIFVDICWNVMIFLICFGICWKKPKWKWRNVPTVWLFLPGNIKCHLNLFIEFPTEIPWNTIMSRISLGGCGHCFNE